MMVASTLLEAALWYATALCWPVFPICARSKVPWTPHGLHDATRDQEQIRRWWAERPDSNIGVPTGATFLALDIDTKNHGEVAFEELIGKHGELPPGPISLTGGGGRHYLFHGVPGLRNTASVFGHGIDTRAEGGYIVVPPSVHESGKAYAWDLDPSDCALPDAPAWLAGKPAPVNGHGNLGLFVPGALPHDGSPAPEGSRNMALASLVGQWIREGKAPRQTWRLAGEWNKTNPKPLSQAELDKTCDSIWKTAARKAGVDLTELEPIVILEEEDDQVIEALTAEAISLAPFDDYLLQPPGFLGDLCALMNERTPKLQPAFSLANSLALFGAIVGRKVATKSNLRTNIYCIGVGVSGSGKNGSRDLTMQILEEAGLSSRILSGHIESDTGLLSALQNRPSCLFLQDEIGAFLVQTAHRNSQSYQRAIPTVLTKLFSSAGSTYLGKEYADQRTKPRIDLCQPNACLYGTTVPTTLDKGITPSEIRDGFFGRMLVFHANEADPQTRSVDLSPIPDEILKFLNYWMSRNDLPRPHGNVGTVNHNIPLIVPATEEAEEAFTAFGEHCREMQKKHRDGSGIDALWARGVEHARKVALIVACGCQPETPKIELVVARYATKLVNHLLEVQSMWIERNVSENQRERNLQRVLEFIRKAGGMGLSGEELHNKTRWLGRSERSEILADLVSAGKIVQVKRPSLKRPALVWRIR